MSWDNLERTKAPRMDHSSVSLPLISIPRDIAITSGSPEDSLIPTRTSSLFFKDLKMKVAVDRAHFFIHGKYDELMKSMNVDEKR